MTRTMLVLKLQDGEKVEYWMRGLDGAPPKSGDVFVLSGDLRLILEIADHSGNVWYLSDHKLQDDFLYIPVRPHSFVPSQREQYIKSLEAHGWRDDPLPMGYGNARMLAREPQAMSTHPRRPQTSFAQPAAAEMERV